MFKIHSEAESPNEGVCLRYIMNGNRQMKGRLRCAYLYIHDEAESPNEGVV